VQIVTKVPRHLTKLHRPLTKPARPSTRWDNVLTRVVTPPTKLVIASTKPAEAGAQTRASLRRSPQNRCPLMQNDIHADHALTKLADHLSKPANPLINYSDAFFWPARCLTPGRPPKAR
jgi:hypothetical protein